MNTGPRHRIEIAKGRFEAFSDGVFAIAITLLVLELHPPGAVDTDAKMVAALLALWPELLVYFASFITIGIMWFNHYALFHNVRTISYSVLVTNLALLMLVCFLPFATDLLTAQGRLAAPAAELYGLTCFGLSVCYNVLWYAVHVPPGQSGSIGDFLRKRNVWNTSGPIAYGAGTLVAWISPLASIALFAAIALYYLSPHSVRGALEASEHTDEA